MAFRLSVLMIILGDSHTPARLRGSKLSSMKKLTIVAISNQCLNLHYFLPPFEIITLRE